MLLCNAKICTKYYTDFRIKFPVQWIRNIANYIYDLGNRLHSKSENKVKQLLISNLIWWMDEKHYQIFIYT